MASNFGDLCRDIIGGTLQIKSKTVLDSETNMRVKNANIRGNLLVNGDLLVLGNVIFEQDIEELSTDKLLAGNICAEELIVGNVLGTTVSSQYWNQVGSDIYGLGTSGISVALSSNGTTVAIGAYTYNLSNGTTRIYDLISGVWTQRGLSIDGVGNSGISVTISSDGNTVAIGARIIGAGHVKIFDWSGSAWVQRGSDIYGESADDRSGTSVSMSSDGNTVAIGAPYNDGNGSNAGQVRVYDWSGSNWVQRGIDIDGEASNNNSGFSISMSNDGNTLVIGAWGNGGNGPYSGHVRIYDWTGSAWMQRGVDIDGEATIDLFGYSVDISADGNTVAIGAPYNDGNGSNSGHVRIYDWSGSAWVQRGSDIDGEAAGDYSGISVAMSYDGNTVAIGAYFNNSQIGHVRVYDWSGINWIQRGIDIDGVAVGGRSGWSVAISSDGNIVAIGAPYEEKTRIYKSINVSLYTATSLYAVGQVCIDNGSSTKLVTDSFNDTATWSHNASIPTDWENSAPTTLAEAIDRLASAYRVQFGVPVPQI